MRQMSRLQHAVRTAVVKRPQAIAASRRAESVPDETTKGAAGPPWLLIGTRLLSLLAAPGDLLSRHLPVGERRSRCPRTLTTNWRSCACLHAWHRRWTTETLTPTAIASPTK